MSTSPTSSARRQKKARGVPDRSVVDHSQLFTVTSLMPSHVIADQLHIDVTAALLSNNVSAVEQIARLWNSRDLLGRK